MTLFEALVLAVVEGLTEYLPVSSTGHIIIASSLMGIASEPFTKNFTVIVQFGAILSVLVLYWRRFVTSVHIYAKLFIAFLPAAVIGFLVKDKIDALLDNVTVVAISLILGGVVLIFVDRWFEKQEKRLSENRPSTGMGSTPLTSSDRMSYGQSLSVGLFQCLAFMPGVSRSAATIIGGLSMKLTGKEAAEFSFLLAVPTLTAASGYKLLKVYETIEAHQATVIIAGNIVSFLVGLITIKAFLGYLTQKGFFVFGVYRIVLGVVLLVLIATGHSLQVV